MEASSLLLLHATIAVEIATESLVAESEVAMESLVFSSPGLTTIGVEGLSDESSVKDVVQSSNASVGPTAGSFSLVEPWVLSSELWSGS